MITYLTPSELPMEGSRNRVCFGVSSRGDGGFHRPEGLCRQRRSARREQLTDRPPLYEGGGLESAQKTAHCSPIEGR
jgi:hypothetical protein